MRQEWKDNLIDGMGGENHSVVNLFGNKRLPRQSVLGASTLLQSLLASEASFCSQHLASLMKEILRKVNFAFTIPNPSLGCSYIVLNVWPNLSLVVLIKLFL